MHSKGLGGTNSVVTGAASSSLNSVYMCVRSSCAASNLAPLKAFAAFFASSAFTYSTNANLQ
ncbi:hypothetical protein EON62_01015 [archaeon]|nr:MAG: hypothetical protein EON62_01015 [archaeon]